MMKKIAFYGKGGIGKSTTAANVSAAFSKMGKKVCQIGCDPKNDSTRLLLGQICRQTVLDLVRDAEDDIQAEQIVHTGFNGIKNEHALLTEFARRLNTKLIAFIPRNVIVNKAENNRQTVIEYAPDSEQAQVYRNLADDILKNTELSIPTPLNFEELEELVASYGNQD